MLLNIENYKIYKEIKNALEDLTQQIQHSMMSPNKVFKETDTDQTEYNCFDQPIIQYDNKNIINFGNSIYSNSHTASPQTMYQQQNVFNSVQNIQNPKKVYKDSGDQLLYDINCYQNDDNKQVNKQITNNNNNNNNKFNYSNQQSNQQNEDQQWVMMVEDNQDNYEEQDYQDQTEEIKPKYTGRLKFFDEQKGYGFIIKDQDSSDVFVHFDDLLKAGITKEQLKQHKNGQVLRFNFQLCSYYGKYDRSRKAVDIQLITKLNDQNSNNYYSNSYKSCNKSYYVQYEQVTTSKGSFN